MGIINWNDTIMYKWFVLRIVTLSNNSLQKIIVIGNLQPYKY